MHTEDMASYCHSHADTTPRASHERRTWLVVALTGLTMVGELIAGYLTGSMALLADGWHMATHVGALLLAGVAYWFARRQAKSSRFTFGTGKVYALAGYTNAVLLGVAALWIMFESIERVRHPVKIQFDVALGVAAIGLVVNLVCALLLGHGHEHGDHVQDDHDHDDHEHAHATDHNLRSAYLHVLADALTSVLAIGALLGGRVMGWAWLDPAMGIVGALVILRWGYGLCRQAASALLDVVPSDKLRESVRKAVETLDDTRVSDLHLWELGPGRFGCIVSLVSSNPRDTEEYRTKILAAAHIDHLTVEVTRCVPGPQAIAELAGAAPRR